MNKSTWAKIFGWVGAALTTISASGLLGKYGVLGTIAGGLLTSSGIHQASNTGGQQ